jgi:hypothetical protein
MLEQCRATGKRSDERFTSDMKCFVIAIASLQLQAA